MTVAQLIELLKQQDPNAEVYFKDVWSDESKSIDNVFDDEDRVNLF